mmetsp:Transcript_27509/g.58794  ORF Transcript_27509/g.58794 Transcript_27509/m.58794 type:complete len:279 (+) Transcript_27509:417-1253(+)
MQRTIIFISKDVSSYPYNLCHLLCLSLYSLRPKGRWHFMSLVRDSRRLERLAMHLSNSNNIIEGDGESGLAALEQAANYVVNFNMAGLFRIHSKICETFLRTHLCEKGSIGPFTDDGDASAETDAFRKLVDKFDEHRVQSENAGRVLYERVKSASTSSNKQQLLSDVARSSTQLLDRLVTMHNLHETLIVPAVSRVVPSKVQKSFSNKVLLSLGLLESRLHLVGMHDAVWESGVGAEKKLFESEIPYVARVMIERWRQSLYTPKAGGLDYGLTIKACS